MNKNANSVRHLQNAAIAVLTVSAVFLLVQTPLVGDLAGKTPYELAQDWLAGDTSAETSVATLREFSTTASMSCKRYRSVVKAVSRLFSSCESTA